MSAPANIHQQIDWMEDQIAHMKRKLPIGVRNGNITQAHADTKWACATAALGTLKAIRSAVYGKEAAHG